MAPLQQHKRPVYLNLIRLHLPFAGWVSILHRIAGVVLYLSLPLFLYLLELSLRHEAGFAQASALVQRADARLLMLAVIAALAHHLLAGLRHLGLDVHWAVEKGRARRSAAVVLVGTGVVTLIAAWGLFS